jgi:hypothetical protein
MKLLVTASLLGSWHWYLDSWEDGEVKAKADFLNTLEREPIPDNEAMAEGRRFEDAVHSACIGSYQDEDEDYNRCVHEIADYVKGGQWQVKAMKDITIGSQDFLAYGRLDILKGPWISDIKYSHTFEAGKYRDSPQTKMYLSVVDGPIGMRYLISDGHHVFVDEYRRDDIDPIENEITEFWSWLDMFPEFREIYLNKWQSY